MAEYATVAEIRAYTGVSTYDWADAAIEEMIGAATTKIDRMTGRTWQGTQTVTDEYYTGNDDQILFLDHVDIASITALSINISPTGSTYTSVTTTKLRFVDGLGLIELQPDAEVNYFPQYKNSVKISYTYGNTTIPDDIKLACRYLVAYMMKVHAELHQEFNNIINQYKINRYRIV